MSDAHFGFRKVSLDPGWAFRDLERGSGIPQRRSEIMNGSEMLEGAFQIPESDVLKHFYGLQQCGYGTL